MFTLREWRNRLRSFILMFSHASLLSESLLTYHMKVGNVLSGLPFRGLAALLVVIVSALVSNAQPLSLSLPEAIDLGVQNYQLI